MSKMSELYMDIAEAVEQGKDAESIAREMSVPIEWVLLVAAEVSQVGPEFGEEDGQLCMG